MPANLTHPATTIAKYIIWKCQEENIPISNKKLQKLLYYSQAWNLVFQDQPLFSDQIEAWIHGPAVRSVYEEYKTFGRDTISTPYSQTEALDGLTPDQIQILDAVLDVYGKKDAQYLEILSHSEDPWIIARNNLPEYESSTAIITTDSMKVYYGRKMAESETPETSTEAG